MPSTFDAFLNEKGAGPVGRSELKRFFETSAGVSMLGTANTGVTAHESGVAERRSTRLVVNTTMPAIAGGAALAVGKLLYTFPAGAIWVESAYFALTLDEVDGNITADTPDGGLGTTIASGAVSVLGGTAAFEDILTGQTFNDCNGTEEEVATISSLYIAPAANHTVYFNLADLWAASGETALPVAGTVVLNWNYLSQS